MIFMGLSIGDNANQLVPRHKPVLDLLRTDRHKIDFAAIGCASGVAAAFRSPIGKSLQIGITESICCNICHVPHDWSHAMILIFPFVASTSHLHIFLV